MPKGHIARSEPVAFPGPFSKEGRNSGLQPKRAPRGPFGKGSAAPESLRTAAGVPTSGVSRKEGSSAVPSSGGLELLDDIPTFGQIDVQNGTMAHSHHADSSSSSPADSFDESFHNHVRVPSSRLSIASRFPAFEAARKRPCGFPGSPDASPILEDEPLEELQHGRHPLKSSKEIAIPPRKPSKRWSGAQSPLPPCVDVSLAGGGSWVDGDWANAMFELNKDLTD